MKKPNRPSTPYPAKAIPAKYQKRMTPNVSFDYDIYSAPLEVLFFPVNMYRLFWEDENDFFFADHFDHYECEDRYAVVGVKNHFVYSTVTKGYFLVLNEEIYQLGIEIAEYIFNTEEDDLTAHLDVLTKNGAACEFSIHRTIELNQPALLGGWRAVIKMTNSYNKTKPVSYIIGFEYETDGGAIFLPEFTHKIKDAHSRPLEEIRKEIFDDLNHTPKGDTIKQIEALFQKLIVSLQAIKMSKSDMLKMFCKVYIKKYTNVEYFKELDYIYEKIKQYSKVGNNTAYTLLLAFGDYVRYRYGRGFGRDLANNQLELGSWAMAFASESMKPEFSLYSYFGKEISDYVSLYMSERGL